MKQIFFQVLILLILSSCDYVDDRLVIKNESNKPISVVFSHDTIFPEISNIEYYIVTALEPNEVRHISKPGSLDAWPYYVKFGNSKKLTAYFFDVDTLKKYHALNFKNYGRLFKKKIEISRTDLEKINWTLSYKGD